MKFQVTWNSFRQVDSLETKSRQEENVCNEMFTPESTFQSKFNLKTPTNRCQRAFFIRTNVTSYNFPFTSMA